MATIPHEIKRGVHLRSHRAIRKLACFVVTPQVGDCHLAQWLPLGTHPDMLNIGGNYQVRRIELLCQQPCYRVLVDYSLYTMPPITIVNHRRATPTGGATEHPVLEQRADDVPLEYPSRYGVPLHWIPGSDRLARFAQLWIDLDLRQHSHDVASSSRVGNDFAHCPLEQVPEPALRIRHQVGERPFRGFW